jgi:DUF1126 PH-like domain
VVLNALNGASQQVEARHSNSQLLQQRPSTAGPLGRSASLETGLLQSQTIGYMQASLGLPRKQAQYAVPRRDPSVPHFVETDKIVLRFYGHFFENRVWDEDGPLGKPIIENTMSRKLTIFYYVTDQTVEISETKQANSGEYSGAIVHMAITMTMTIRITCACRLIGAKGGRFFKRAPLMRSDGEPIELFEFAPGNVIHCLGQEIFITDADLFTRDYFRLVCLRAILVCGNMSITMIAFVM